MKSTGFSVEVAKEWERAFSRSHCLRHDKSLYVLPSCWDGWRRHDALCKLVKYGLGGVQGTGKQKFSWIHVEDLYRMILFYKREQS